MLSRRLVARPNAVAWWAVAMAGYALALAGCGSSSGSSDATGTPVEVAMAWMAAYEIGDVETFQALMSPDATALCEGCGYDRAVAPYFGAAGGVWNDIRDSRMLVLANGSINPSCTASESGVRCTTERISDFGFSTEDGQPTQTDQSTYEFAIEAGAITHLTVTRTVGNLYDFSKIQDYQAWLAEHHPDEFDDLFSFGTILVTTDDQFEQHQNYLDEYLATP